VNVITQHPQMVVTLVKEILKRPNHVTPRIVQWTEYGAAGASGDLALEPVAVDTRGEYDNVPTLLLITVVSLVLETMWK